MTGKRLDLTGIWSEGDFHDRVVSAFGFPYYYGRNLDAFDECFDEFCSGHTIYVSGLSDLPTSLRGLVDRYLNVMKELALASPDLFDLVIE